MFTYLGLEVSGFCLTVQKKLMDEILDREVERGEEGGESGLAYTCFLCGLEQSLRQTLRSSIGTWSS